MIHEQKYGYRYVEQAVEDYCSFIAPFLRLYRELLVLFMLSMRV